MKELIWRIFSKVASFFMVTKGHFYAIQCKISLDKSTKSRYLNISFDFPCDFTIIIPLQYFLKVQATALRSNPVYYRVYYVHMNTIFASLIPLASLLFFNVCTLIALRKMIKVRYFWFSQMPKKVKERKYMYNVFRRKSLRPFY